jgi:hypothetical protein
VDDPLLVGMLEPVADLDRERRPSAAEKDPGATLLLSGWLEERHDR